MFACCRLRYWDFVSYSYVDGKQKLLSSYVIELREVFLQKGDHKDFCLNFVIKFSFVIMHSMLWIQWLGFRRCVGNLIWGAYWLFELLNLIVLLTFYCVFSQPYSWSFLYHLILVSLCLIAEIWWRARQSICRKSESQPFFKRQEIDHVRYSVLIFSI